MTKKLEKVKNMENIKLGDEVIDIASGFKGVAIGRTQWLYGCGRITIQPKVGKDGKLPDDKTFDELGIKIIKTIKEVKEKKVKTGGFELNVNRKEIKRY